VSNVLIIKVFVECNIVDYESRVKRLSGLGIKCYSAEIPTRCSFVIEFIIPKFIEGAACFERPW
jgi:hypothetical protein